jgi:O-acetyl-ADP-ribose deacetylase (regulator of RNase III)
MFRGVAIEVVHGDITKLEVDAIVNAANTHLYMGGGVAGAIKRAGGKEIEEEAVKKGPIKIGEAVVTSAGKIEGKVRDSCSNDGARLQNRRTKSEAGNESRSEKS